MSEIVEEEEEEQRAIKRQSTLNNEDQPATKRQSLQPKTDGDRPVSPPADPVKLDADLAASPENSKFSASNTSELPNFMGIDDNRPTSSAKTIDVGRRMSSQSTRPDVFGYSAYAYSKPKVKLGPRPSLDVGGRPQTAGNFRPVSQIPAGLKLFGKGAKKGKAKGDTGASSAQSDIPEVDFSAIVAKLPVPEDSSRSQVEPVRPNTSSGVSTVSSIMPGTTTTAKPAISREKARLMKAMKQREQKKKQKNAAEPAVADNTALTTTGSEETPAEKPEEDAEEKETAEEAGKKPGKRLSIVKADSAVAIETLVFPVHTDQGSERTQTDSHPASPVIASSEPDQSTKASSLSEGTDETVQAKDGTGEKDNEKPGEQLPEDEDQTPEEAKSEVTEMQASGQECEEPVEAGDEPPVDASDVLDESEQATAVHVEDSEKPAEIQPVEENDSKNDAAEAKEPSDVQDVKAVETVEHQDEQAVAVALPMTTEETGTTGMDQQPEDTETKEEDAPETTDEEIAEPSNNSSLPSEQPQDPEPSHADPEASQLPESTTGSEAVPTTEENEEEQEEEQDEELEPLKIPKSKFSTQDLRNATAPSLSSGAPPMPESAKDFQAKQHEAEQTKHSKRKTFIEPIRTDLANHSRATSRSGDNLSDDEALMDELQSATVQEAKPMLVAKTPVTPGFPSIAAAGGPLAGSSSTPATPPLVVRTVSNPARNTLILHQDVGQPSARSMSSGAAYLHRLTQQQQQGGGGGASGKASVGSSISQRIKALEMLTANSAEAAAATTTSQGSSGGGARERPSSRFFSVRKSRELSRSPSMAERANSFRKTSPQSQLDSRDASPDVASPRRERSTSVASRRSVFESPPRTGYSHGNTGPRGRPESISVTARIIRDPAKNGDHGHLDLKQSPLLVDHQKGSEVDVVERRTSRDSRRSEMLDDKEVKRRRSSLSIVKDFIKEGRKSLTSPSTDTLVGLPPTSSSRSPTRPPSTHQNNSIAARLSIHSRRSGSYDRDAVLSEGSGSGSASGDDSKSDKKRSRAGRLMRRLSSLSGGSSSRGKMASPTSLSPTVAEEDDPELAAPTSPSPPAARRPATTPAPSAVQSLGDVNVQFPDTLLWKRRHMGLDAQGFLVLSALPGSTTTTISSSSAQTGAPGSTKRYHLSQFRAPYAPDVELQELPNSVVLDLLEGGGVQVACEDRAGQTRVLQGEFC